jgi:peptidoglycan-N-acetylmuramic acid deacetylase
MPAGSECKAGSRSWRTGVGRALVVLSTALGPVANACDKPVYLTFDTGHMGVADLVAEVLRRHEVKATFFLANERTLNRGTSLDERWAPWWRARVAEGHAFGSHTWDHWVLTSAALRFKPTQGAQAGRVVQADANAYCEQLRAPAERFRAMTGAELSAIFRAPAGRTSPALEEAAQRCGFAHVGWAPAGFLGDELPSERYPNAQLLDRALRTIRPGDILVAHLGIWSRREPWAPEVLEPLITGLKARGLCFRTLRDHPDLGPAARTAALGQRMSQNSAHSPGQSPGQIPNPGLAR